MVRIKYDGDVADIGTVEELGVVLDLVPAADNGLILAQIGKQLPELVGSDEAFLKVLGRIFGVKGGRKRKFLEYYKDGMGRVVTSGETLRHALSLLAHDDDQKFLLDALGRDGIRACIRRMEDIAGCLEWLHGEMDLYFLELTGFDFVIRFVKDGDNLAQLLKNLGPVEERKFIEFLGWKRIQDCIQTRRDLYSVLNALEEDDERTLIRKMPRKKLRHILTFDFHVDELCDLHLTRGNGRLVRAKYYGKRTSSAPAARKKR